MWPIRYRRPRRRFDGRNPVDLCITQARYTQLHRSIKYSQGKDSVYFVRGFANGLTVRHAMARQIFHDVHGFSLSLSRLVSLSLLLSLIPRGLRGARAAATLRR